jgi:hypothetical protein
MSGFEPEIADQPSVARCLLDAGLVVIGAVALAVVVYFLVILAAIILGVAAFVVLGRIAARMML